MSDSPIEERLRRRVHSFATELAGLVKRAALEAVDEALREGELAHETPRPSPPRRGRGSRLRPYELPARRPVPRAAGELSFDHYEAMAIRRALAESQGHVGLAAELLGVGQSTLYRRMGVLGIHNDDTDVSGDPVLASAEPLSFDAYEKAAVVRAVEEAGGSKLQAAKLLRVGKSTLFRKAAKHGI